MKELKPAFRFLAVFIGAYFCLNILYGIWISSFGSSADYATKVVTNQTALLLNVFGEDTHTAPKASSPAISILNDKGAVLSVFEGCNGINLMIVFVSFLAAFGGKAKNMTWFIPLGLFLIYLANLMRVMMLYFIAKYQNEYFYYAHKYVLTAFLYLMVFALWWWWIEKVNKISIRKAVTNQ